MSRRFAIDTNLYIDALRTEAGHSELSAFLFARTPFIVMSAVVVHELRAGVRTPAAINALESHVIGPMARRGRLIVPSLRAWTEAGRILAELAGPGQWDSLRRSVVNDVLLAMSCRESGVVLVTKNLRDCERIARITSFDFVAPWPWRRRQLPSASRMRPASESSSSLMVWAIPA